MITEEGITEVKQDLIAEEYDIHDARKRAEDWVKESAPTYVYDGFGLEIEDVLPVNGCDGVCTFVFNFTSRHGGYGDRSGKAVAEALTPHVIEVEMVDGEITSAITDGFFDEMEGN